MSTQNPTDGTPQALPEHPQRGSRKGLVIGAVIVVLAIVAGVIGWAVTRKSDAQATTTVKIGTTEAGASFWPIFKKKAAEQGITIEVVSFNDYNQPNRALSQKQIDLNYFQHIFFLANYDHENKDTLIPLDSTYVVPLGLYSKKHTSVSQIPQGGKIAIPNDATNQGRALLVLQSAGLLTLRNGGSALSTPADIDTAKSKVTVTPVDAAQTVTALPSVDGAVINNGFARDANIDPSSALYADSAKSSTVDPYINIFAARAADKNNATYLKVTKIWHDEEVEKAVLADSKNSAVIVQGRSQADLQKISDNLQAELAKKG